MQHGGVQIRLNLFHELYEDGTTEQILLERKYWDLKREIRKMEYQKFLGYQIISDVLDQVAGVKEKINILIRNVRVLDFVIFVLKFVIV